jgi:chorismate dehydratase
MVKAYLTHNIHYFLDAECLAGLRLFYQYAEECRALPEAAPLRFLEVAQAAAS